MLVDSHCHLDMLEAARSGAGIEPVLAEAAAAGVGHMLCVSVDLDAYPAMRALVEPHAQVSASVGVHPNHRYEGDDLVARLTELAADPRVVAIGETGLDYFRSEGDLDWQRRQFSDHITVARQTGKPLIIHTREAREDTIAQLRAEDAGVAGGVMHCFAEDWATAQASLDLGFYISFSGIVTFKNATELKEVAKRMPLDRLLVETDSPYLAPVPKRGKPNQPAWVAYVAEHIAELRGEPVALIREASTENFFRLFSAARAA